MLKVATVTYHRHNNYGAMLQAYALQQVLIDMGVDTEIIDYRCPTTQKPFSFNSIKSRGLVASAMSLIGSISRVPRKKAFEEFRSTLRLSREVDEKSIESLEEYDTYIVGSDNVWNPYITGRDPYYFLKFVKDDRKRNSYAASFGTDKIPEELKAEYIELLQGMNSFNIREQSGVKIINSILNREAENVLDPTLLLEQEKWNKIAGKVDCKEKYVLAYQLVPSKTFVNIVKKIAKKKGLKVIFVPFAVGGIIKAKNAISAGPKEWLGLIKNAEIIVTDSFHGCVFSILFNKSFVVSISQLATRIENLLSMLGLESRIVKGEDISVINDEIDYLKINKIIEKQRIKSLNTLNRVIKNAEAVRENNTDESRSE